MRKLIIVSGADRVGKTTLVKQLSEAFPGAMPNIWGYSADVVHFAAPDTMSSQVFQMYRDAIAGSKAPLLIWDRSYVCGSIYERCRFNSHDHFSELVELEMELNEEFTNVIHIGLFKPWNWSAKLILKELNESYPEASKWAIRNRYIASMNEHQFYQDELKKFYTTITMFPSIGIEDTNPDPKQVVKLAQTVVENFYTK